MEELILKMHEELMEFQKATTEMKCLLANLQDAIEKKEIESANCTWNSRKDVENTKIEVSEIKHIIGMGPDICRYAEEILKRRENGEKDE